MHLILTSDLPTTPNEPVLERMRIQGQNPRVAWIPPTTASGRQHFPAAKAQFAACGLDRVEYVDIDQAPDVRQLATLEQFDALYLSGGDPVRFRQSLARVGLSAPLRRYLNQGGLIVAASGGSMQLTPNVSLYRLREVSLEVVIAEREAYGALGFVDYELLPHLNRFAPDFLETVRQYSEQVPIDVVAIADGAAVVHAGDKAYHAFGRASRYRNGVTTDLASA